MRSILSEIWAELRTPEVGGNWYAWATIATGHVLLGALFITAASLWGSFEGMGVLIAVFYWLIKETRDLRRGGIGRDGLTDLGFVYLGTFYGAAWLPAVSFALIGLGVALAIARQDDRF